MSPFLAIAAVIGALALTGDLRAVLIGFVFGLSVAYVEGFFEDMDKDDPSAPAGVTSSGFRGVEHG